MTIASLRATATIARRRPRRLAMAMPQALSADQRWTRVSRVSAAWTRASRTPLSTLHVRPHDRPRMTRGRCGSLLLHRNGLAPSALCRSPGAPDSGPSSIDDLPAGVDPTATLVALGRGVDYLI